MPRTIWHKRFHSDALNGYMGLTLEERGAYTTVLDLLYDSDWSPGIRDDDRYLAGHMGATPRKWRTIRDTLIEAGKLDLVDGLLSNKRYRIERENALKISRTRAESGKNGGGKSGEVRRNAAENRRSGEANASDLSLYARASSDAEAESEVRKDSAPPTTTVEHASAGADDVERGNWDAVSLTDHVARVAGVRHLEPGRIASNIAAVREWLNAGADPPMIAAAVQSGRDRSTSPIHSLKYFDAGVRRALAQRDHPNARPANDLSEISDPLLRRYLENGGKLDR